MPRPWPDPRRHPRAGGYDREHGEQPSLNHSTARHCAHCEIPMPNAPAWHRLCGQCYRMARVETYIGKALRLLREIQARDGVRR
jgi:hypothetical protein